MKSRLPLLIAFCVAAPLAAHGQTQSLPIYSYSVPAGGYAPNGNVLSSVDSVNGAWAMSYDGLNRLRTATATSGPYQSLALQWQIDSFGNRESQSASGSPLTGGNYTNWAHYTDASNRVSSSNQAVGGLTYDGSGNVTYDGVNSYAYDAENRLCAAGNMFGITQYIYDPEGNRVAKARASSVSCYTGSGTPTVMAAYVVGPSGEQITELNGAGVWQHSNVYGAGQLLATYSASSLYFPITDPLGTVRVWTPAVGPTGESCSSLPFGDVQTCSGTDPSEHHYTGKERDAESGLDYFGARYYSSAMGRFSSPDPSGLVYADPTNPQSLNLYSYAANNPLKNTDPTGLAYCQWDDGSHDDSANTGVAGAVNSGTECTNAGGSWSHADGLGDDGNPLVTRDADLSVTVKYHPPDPDDQRIQELVQGVATDTAGFPTVCSVGGYAQVGLGPVAGGYQYDSSKGGSAYNNFRATPGNPGSMPSIAPGNNGSIPMGDPSPFSATVKRTASGGYSGGATVRDPVTGVGGGVSVNEKGTPTVSASVQRGPVTVGATATLGTIGNPACQMGPVHR